MDIGKDILVIKELAKKAGLPMEKFLEAAATLKEFEKEQEDGRSASSDDKQKLDAYFASLNGNVSADLQPADIVIAAGVDRKQGTVSYARYHLKQLLLTHQK
jgi:hypothetical protein